MTLYRLGQASNTTQQASYRCLDHRAASVKYLARILFDGDDFRGDVAAAMGQCFLFKAGNVSRGRWGVQKLVTHSAPRELHSVEEGSSICNYSITLNFVVESREAGAEKCVVCCMPDPSSRAWWRCLAGGGRGRVGQGQGR